LSCQNLTVHDDNFKSTVRIIPVRIKDQSRINKGGFNALNMKKSEAKVEKKIMSFPSFFSPLSAISLAYFFATRTPLLLPPAIHWTSLHH
jgi:hypothetical protein